MLMSSECFAGPAKGKFGPVQSLSKIIQVIDLASFLELRQALCDCWIAL
jgi:hypothetical protein